MSSFRRIGPFAGKVVGKSASEIATGAAGLSVTGAILLILELNRPFTGMLQIPQTGFFDAIGNNSDRRSRSGLPLRLANFTPVQTFFRQTLQFSGPAAVCSMDNGSV